MKDADEQPPPLLNLQHHNQQHGEHHRQSHLQNIFASMISSVVARLFAQPFDVLKIRFQVQDTHPHVKRYHSTVQAFRLIYHEEGLRTFMRGHTAAQIQGLLQNVMQFWLFFQIRAQLNQLPLIGEHYSVCSFMAGYLTGTTAVLTLGPLDLLRTRKIAERGEKPERLLDRINRVYATGGVRSFYRGSHLSLVHVGALMGSKFMLYGNCCHVAMHFYDVEDRNELPALVLLGAGALSGALSNVITYPLGVVKRRLQVERNNVQPPELQCRKFVQCTRMLFKRGGILAFFAGLKTSAIRTGVATALQFSLFDKIYGYTDQFFQHNVMHEEEAENEDSRTR